ncbi:hypothetical protein OH492_14755 [Vibrio chagasii]|nr:hypothetical protein [Vibrio chagasii]
MIIFGGRQEVHEIDEGWSMSLYNEHNVLAETIEMPQAYWSLVALSIAMPWMIFKIQHF